MEIRALQDHIQAAFGTRDRARGADGTFRRLVEEVGEVAKALRAEDPAALALELADVVAWTVSLAVMYGIDLDVALHRYDRGCPRCRAPVCRCPIDPAVR